MVRLVEERLEEIRRLCERHRVRRLFLIGSGTDPDRFDEAASDLDFEVEFEPFPREGFSDPYFALLADLRRLFGRDVDLIEAGAVRNSIVAGSMASAREPLYAAAA